MFSSLIQIARIDHWFKNIFVLPGIALGLLFVHHYSLDMIFKSVLGLFTVCIIASANYTINEWLDAEFDRCHPVKKNRPSAAGKLTAQAVYSQYAVLSLVGLSLAWSINSSFFLAALMLLIMGVVYNVEPMRSKDRPFLDVLSESINNPIRLLLGWFIIVPNAIPPSSILISYWMGGAFLMTVKRYGEYRFINNPEVAGQYRKSFVFYTEETLLLSAFFYAIMSSFFLAIFLIKYRIEFLLAFPLFTILFVWYLWIGMQRDSIAQNPERLVNEKNFITYISFMTAAIVLLFFIDIPSLNYLLNVHEYRLGN